MKDRKKLLCQPISKELNLDERVGQIITGINDEHLSIIATRTQTKIKRRGEKILVEGLDSDVYVVEEWLAQLTHLAKQGVPIYSDDVRKSVEALCLDSNISLAEIFGEKIEIQGSRRIVYAKTHNQSRFINLIKSNRVVFGFGPAGTGKTYLSVALGVNKLVRKDVKKLILCRPAVEAGEKLGFLPGTIEEKVDPYMRPLFDALFDLLDADKIQEFLSKGVIEIAPLAFMRGRTLSHSFVVLDEAQNTTIPQMKMFLTRLGFGSTFVINGDPTQIDLPKSEYSGLLDAVNRLMGIEGIALVNFTKEDVVRDPLVSRILQAYED